MKLPRFTLRNLMFITTIFAVGLFVAQEFWEGMPPRSGDNKRGQTKGDIINIERPRMVLYNRAMPRTARASVGGMWYHVLNRGNRREAVFHEPGDYDAFVEAIIDARARLGVDVLGYRLMPKHFLLGIRRQADGDLGRWVQWLLMAHARRYHRHYGTSGHVWQGRFKAFSIQDDDHLRTVLRYVERNPLRAGTGSAGGGLD